MPDTTVSINWDRPMLERFRKALAENEGHATFVFDGHEFMVAYAKYLIEHLDGVFLRSHG